jgi:sugar (pentulose or hexulose) kinase
VATSTGRVGVVLGIDIGSTNLKVAALNDEGSMVACSRRPTTRGEGSPCVDAAGLFDLLEEMILEACANRFAITALCVAGVGEDGVLVDETMTPLAPALAWFDPRRVALFDELAATLPPASDIGVATDPTRTLVGWAFARRQPEATHAHHWLALTDFAASRWSGRPFLSDTLAARTAAWRITDRTWIHDRVEATLGAVDLLPDVVATGHVVGPLRSTRLHAAGVIAPDAVVVAGGHDHPIGGWGVDLLHPGAILDSMGTAEVVVAQSPSRHIVRRDHVDLAPGIRNDGTTLLRVDELARNIEWASRDTEVGATLRRLISGAQRPNDYLFSKIFLPGAAGGGTPRYADDAPTDPLSRASAVLGALAALGGESVRAVAALTTPAAPVYAAGGWARSRGWVEAKEAVTGTVVNTIAQPEVTAVGAALLAATATGFKINPTAALAVATHR